MKIRTLFGIFILLLAICLLPYLLIWIHHHFIFGLNPFVAPAIGIIIFLVLLPFLIKWYRWLNRHWISEENREAVALFAMGSLCWFIMYTLRGNTTADILLHDTYYIVSYYYIALRLSLVFGIFCLIYYLFPRILNCDLYIKLSRIHFWVTYIGFNLLGIGYTKRIFIEPQSYIGWPSYNRFRLFDTYMLTVLILVAVAQFLFLFNIIYSLISRKKLGIRTKD